MRHLLAALALLLAVPRLAAEPTKPVEPAKPATPAAPAANSAVIPVDRLNLDWWKQRHEAVLKKLDPATEVLFIGDSITQGWEGKGKEVFAASFGPWKTLNLGFSGDKTEHVLWRFAHGELEGLKPKVAVIMIGTNNTGHIKQPAAETAAGVEKILTDLHAKCPDTQVILVAILPRGATPADPLRQINDAINKILATFPAKMDYVTYKDYGTLFLDKDGVLSKDIMPDLLHPGAAGYKIWAEALTPEIKKLMK